MAWQNKAPSGVDATVAGLLRYPNNATLQMSCSFELTSQSVFEIRGTEGTLIIPDAFKPGRNLVGLLHMNGLEEESIDFPEEDLYLGEVDDIADAVMEGKPTTLSLEESRQNIATLVALLQSAEEGRPVQVAV
jgi:predicted dehydrogenase